MNFTNPLRKTISPQIYPKITKKFTKQPKTTLDMWDEQRDF